VREDTRTPQERWESTSPVVKAGVLNMLVQEAERATSKARTTPNPVSQHWHESISDALTTAYCVLWNMNSAEDIEALKCSLGKEK